MAFVDGRHADAPVEEWVFAAWREDGTLGVISGHRILGRTAWYWAALARAGRPLLHIADFDVTVRRADPFIVKGEALWAEHTRDAPMEQWSIGNETYATALDDPADALGRAYGTPTPIAFDLEWYATGAPEPLTADDRTESAADAAGSSGAAGPSSGHPARPRREGAVLGYEQPGVVHGRIEILGEPPIDVAEIPAHRWHRWTDPADPETGLAPLPLPEAVAHTGVRAPFAFPDGGVSDLVLTGGGWRRRRPRAG